MTKTEKHLRAEVTRFVRANKELHDKLELQSQSIAKLSADVNRAEAERDALKKTIKERDAEILAMFNKASAQRDAHRAVIETLLDRYDVQNPRERWQSYPVELKFECVSAKPGPLDEEG